MLHNIHLSDYVTIVFNVPETDIKRVSVAIKQAHPYETMSIDIFPIY